MNFIPKKSTLNIDCTTQRLLEAEQESLVVADTDAEQKVFVDTANVLADAIVPESYQGWWYAKFMDDRNVPKHLAVTDRPTKPKSICDRFMSYTQKCCDDWCKHGYPDYI